MPISNFPNGFNYGVAIRGLPVLNTYPSTVFWVDSVNGSNGNDGVFSRPFASIDYAVGRCTANVGDIIMAKAGHVETVSAIAGLDLDVAGITVVFLGNGTNRARVNFTTAVGADMDVDAANITLVNPRFTAGIDALTGPIDVNSANFSMFNGRWEDGTTINTTDCIVADANADNMVIDGWLFVDGDAAGTQKQSHIQVAGATGVILRNIQVTGDFGTGVIENGTAWVDALLENVNLDNASTSPTVAVLLQGTSSGAMRFCTFRVASATTYVTADNDMQFFACYGTGTDATSGEEVGTQLAGGIEAKIDVIDGYFDVPTIDATTDTTMRDVVGRKTDAAAAVGTTKSLVAYAKQTLNQVGTLTNTGGTATVGGIVGDVANVTVANRLSWGGTQLVSKAYADLTGYDTAAAFTVTGDVMVHVVGVVGVTGITSTSGTTTLSVGTTEAAQAIIANSTVNGTQFAATDVWVDSSPADDAETLNARWVTIGGGADIILTGSVDDLTAGTLTLYCFWMPLSSGATVVAA